MNGTLPPSTAPDAATPPPLAVTMQKAAALSGLSVRTLQRLEKNGHLNTVKILGRRLVLVESLHRLIVEGCS
jgi:hypothetical protein